ncbi:hypothetical protein [Yoonia sediminilitoris]|uniref:Uncharacterized protein n=1 Tax=Yoonia sediminilitoris TaxID=1286148 RepID=A0A2T6KDW9_9RHOB|nr:hypothetical protein [Yoonia sediminilitoris]PUB13226.1 hypothetical protein C8N45_108147 [Yoonia sediminilitoris]RCW94561.1 hypothetical protein DFP92_108148 [Yoonia sediminilitoris]
MTNQKETFPGGIRALIARYQRRRSRLTPHAGEDLAPLDIDFKALAQIPLPKQPLPRPEGLSRIAKKRHFLLGELAGQSELAMLHGMLVAHLRKHTHPDHAPALFRRLWTEEQEWLLANLDLRWLVSAVITFADVGETEADRRLAQSLKIFFSLMKLYEAERVYSGHAPQKPFGLGKRAKTPLPMGMQDFSLLRGDLESGLLAPLWQDSHDAPAIGPLVRHLLNALNTDDGTIFRRFALMRQAAERAEKKGG